MIVQEVHRVFGALQVNVDWKCLIENARERQAVVTVKREEDACAVIQNAIVK